MLATNARRTCPNCLEPIKPGQTTRYESSGNTVKHASCRLRHISEMTVEELEVMGADEAFKRGAEWWGGGGN